jgi:hypothetical protein
MTFSISNTRGNMNMEECSFYAFGAHYMQIPLLGWSVNRALVANILIV